MIKETIEFFEYNANDERGRIAYRRWSNEKSASSGRPTIICGHGINQNSRHLVELARRLANDFDVMALDFPGRGLSDYLANKLNYNNKTYSAVCQSFIESLGLNEVYWVGTSMGGLTGMILASLPETRIKRLVLNDIGPVITKSVMQSAAIAGKNVGVRFSTVEEALKRAEKYLANFGMTDMAMKESFMRASLREEPDGTWRHDYDPEIYAYSRVMPELNNSEVPFWQYWSKVTCPVLILHGVNSTALTPQIIEDMRGVKHDIEVVDVPHTGHAPHLMNDEQAGWIRDWLLLP